MNLKITTLLFLFLLNYACAKQEVNYKCSLDEFSLENTGWTPIKKSMDIGCALYLEAFSWNGEAYYSVGSHCADIAPNPFRGCDEKLICESPQANTCEQFYQERRNLGIVAYWTD